MADIKETIDGLKEIADSKNDSVCEHLKCKKIAENALELLKWQAGTIKGLKDSLKETLDVVAKQLNVVRCNECKYGKYDKINQKYQCEKIRQRTWFIIWHDGDFFCKDGEPKDGDGE